MVDSASGRIALESEVGPLRFIIAGAICAWRAPAGELDFQFTSVDILLGTTKVGRLLGQQGHGEEGGLPAQLLASVGSRTMPAGMGLAGHGRAAPRAGRAARPCAPSPHPQPAPLPRGPQLWTVSPKTKPKTYTFYYIGDKVAAARSSAGGLSLLLK